MAISVTMTSCLCMKFDSHLNHRTQILHNERSRPPISMHRFQPQFFISQSVPRNRVIMKSFITQSSRPKTKFGFLDPTKRENERCKTRAADSDMEATEQPFVEEVEIFSWSSVILPFLFPALGGLLFGYDIGATSGASLSLQSSLVSGITWFNLTTLQIGLVVSGSLYGALCGSLLAFRVADSLGNRRELVSAAALYFTGALVSALAPEFTWLVLGRWLFGLGIGLAMHAAPMYIAETCPSQIRGTLVSLKELFIVLGILAGYFVSNLEINVIGGWRLMYGLSIPISIIMGFGMVWLPSSPRWLLLQAVKGKNNQQELKQNAIFALSRLRGRPVGDRVSELQIEETSKILESLWKDQKDEVSFWEVFQGANLKAFIIGGGLVFFQQITGQPSVLYYAASILQSAGFSAASDATRVALVIGFVKLIMTGIAVLKADQLGRKPLLIGGVSGIAASLFCLAAYYGFLGSAPTLAVLALLLYVSCYQISFGPISWLMVSEVFPLRSRGRGISVAVLVNFAMNAMVTFLFSPLKELLGPSLLFFTFGVISVIALLFVIWYVPETKGLTLEEIESKVLT